MKSIRRQKRYSGVRYLHECEEPFVDPMLETEIQDWLMHGLDHLSDEQRLPVELACRMGHSLEEIAAITGAPIGTVKARMFHARRNLRRHLPRLSGVVELFASVE
jgi:RNA polymerase sigma-70 factor (ECF subfamily)